MSDRVKDAAMRAEYQSEWDQLTNWLVLTRLVLRGGLMTPKQLHAHIDILAVPSVPASTPQEANRPEAGSPMEDESAARQVIA